MGETLTCPHTLADKETACADGYCPMCLAAELDEKQSVITAEAVVIARQGAELKELQRELEQLKHWIETQAKNE
jgi:hypothetical protein